MASSNSFTYYCPPSSSPVWSEPLYSLRPEHARERLQDDSVETVTSIEQVRWQDWARRRAGPSGSGSPVGGAAGRRAPRETTTPTVHRCAPWRAPGSKLGLPGGAFVGQACGRVVARLLLRGEHRVQVYCADPTVAQADRTAFSILPGRREVRGPTVHFPLPACGAGRLGDRTVGRGHAIS
jgi:hypothetical protein